MYETIMLAIGGSVGWFLRGSLEEFTGWLDSRHSTRHVVETPNVRPAKASDVLKAAYQTGNPSAYITRHAQSPMTKTRYLRWRRTQTRRPVVTTDLLRDPLHAA